MNLLGDSRDLIELVERNRPVPLPDLNMFFRDHGHELVLSFTNVRELASPLAVEADFLRVRPWLQSLEQMPIRYIQEILVPRREIENSVDAFNSGNAYCNPNPFVRRWDETLMPLPGGQRAEMEQLVNVRLDNIVYWIFQSNPAIFGPPERFLGALRRQFEGDRRALQAGQAQAEEHFYRAILKHATTHRVQLPAGRERQFVEWIYHSPERCAGLQFGHEVYRAMMENVNDVPETADFSDLAHVYALPYVQSATLDRRMRHYCRIASARILARGGIINYSDRVYDDLAIFVGRNA
jgi:hypothetical protein